MKFLLFLIPCILARTYITSGKADDTFHFHASISCNLVSSNYYPIKFWFYEHDKLPSTHDIISDTFEETLKGNRPLDKVYLGREEGDGPHNNDYEFGMEVEHNCNPEGRNVKTDFRFSHEKDCRVKGNPCHLYFQVDLSKTIEGEYNWRSVSLVQN